MPTKWNILTILGSFLMAAMLLGGCSADDQAASPTVAAAAVSGPFFSQSDPRWAGDVYAFTNENGAIWCGSDLSQCGSLITSAATVFWLLDVKEMPDGSPVTPGTLNGWFKGEATRTSLGMASRGYLASGDLDLNAINTLATEISQKAPGCPSLRNAGLGTGSEDEIRAELKAGRPVILEVPGHWIVAVRLDGDKVVIHDPFYTDRKTLSEWAGKVKGSLRFARVAGAGSCPK